MRLITNKSKNLLYRIVDGGNVTVQFSTSYAVATQRTADTDANNYFKIQGYDGTTYVQLKDTPLVLGKITVTFTTPSTTGYKCIRFGLNGASIDALCRCEMDLKPSTTYTFTCNFTNITQGSISWKDMMLVEGNIAGEYEPYSYNLLDKWRYVNSFTSNGNIYTNNGEGSWYINSLNGTANSYNIIGEEFPVTVGHKVLLRANYPFEGGQDLNGGYFYCTGQNSFEINTGTDIYPIPEEVTTLTPRIFVNLTKRVDEKLYTPQVYDLTLMYGAGNEPTTVDQFYTDHPELKVSPIGFIELKNLEISNKNIKRLRYQTGIKKNLFNINNYSTIGSDIGFDISNLEIGKTYTISCNQAPFTWIKISNHGSGYNSVQYAGSEIYSYTFVMSRNSNISEDATQYLFLQMKGTTSPGFARNLSELGVNQIQIEEGSTATFYVDYNGCVDLGIIPSNSGIH